MTMTPKIVQEEKCLWESGELGNSEEHAVVLGAEKSREVDDALAMHMISIRLPKSLIEDLKVIAKREGLGYQPLIRRVLQRFSEAEFKSIAAEMLVREQPSAQPDKAQAEDKKRVAC